MSSNRSNVEKERIAQVAPPVDINSTGIVGDWVGLGKYEHAGMVILIGNIAGTTAVTLQQAINNAGGSAKALPFDFVWKNNVKTAVVSDTFDITGSDDNTVWQIPIDASELDVDNGFSHIQLNLSDPSAAAIVAASYVMGSGRYQGADMPDPTD